MTLIGTIESELTVAMRERDELRRDVLRLALSSLRSAEKELQRPLSEQEELQVLQRERKRRVEAAEAFENAGRAEQAARERDELTVLGEFMPEPISEEELENIVDDAIAEVGATSIRDLGRVMADVMPQVAGRADGSAVTQLVREKLGVIVLLGDRRPHARTHQLIEGNLVAAEAEFRWISTDEASALSETDMATWDALVIPPGTPHRNPRPTLEAIRTAREQGIPLLGCCGGFQYVVVEFVRSVLGILDAEHPEAVPDAEHPAVTPLECSLEGTDQPVSLTPGSLAERIYGSSEIVEPFFCRYGVNPDLLPRIEGAGLRPTGHDSQGQVRVLELEGHPLFLATLYVPGLEGEGANPAIAALVAASLH